jgi:hypothetical protein
MTNAINEAIAEEIQLGIVLAPQEKLTTAGRCQ